MSRTRYRIFEPAYPHFLTCTVVGWLPAFTRPKVVQILLDSLRFLQETRRIVLFGYAVMENHLHLIASAADLGAQIGDFKSYTARKIIDSLTVTGDTLLLRQLHDSRLRHKVDRDYQLWQEGSHPKQIESDDMMLQKLDYTHANPLRRGYVDDALHWRYSSARNYHRLPGLLEVTTNWN